MEPFKNLLVVVDCANQSIDLQPTINFTSHLQAKVKLVAVVRPFSWIERVATQEHEKFRELLTADYAARLELLAAEFRDKGVAVETRVLSGKSSRAITHEVLRDGHDLVIKEAKGVGWYKGFFGTTAIELLRKCPCAVWLTKPGANAVYKRIVAAVFASGADDAHARLNHTILELAKAFCDWEGSRLYPVEAWAVFGEDILRKRMRDDEFRQLIQIGQDDAQRRLESLLADHGLDGQSETAHLLHGDPCLELPKFAEEHQIDMIVMGTIARGGVAGALVGNTAESLLNRVQCSILAVKPDDFVSPITLDE